MVEVSILLSTGVVSADVFLSTLSAAVGGARSTKAQIAAIETFTAVAPLLRDIGHVALRCAIALFCSPVVRPDSCTRLHDVHVPMLHPEPDPLGSCRS